MGDTMAGSMGGSMASGGGVAPSPLTVIGATDGTAGISGWWGGDSRELNGADVSDAANQAIAGSADIEQTTGSKQPELVQVGGRDGFQFVKANVQKLTNGTAATTKLWKASDYMATWMIYRLDTAITNMDFGCFAWLGDNRGGTVRGMRTRVRSTTSLQNEVATIGGTNNVTRNGTTDQSSLHLINMRTEAAFVVLAYDDESDTAQATTNGKMLFEADEITIGDTFAGGQASSITVMDFATWHGLVPITTQQTADMRAMWSDKYSLGF